MFSILFVSRFLWLAFITPTIDTIRSPPPSKNLPGSSSDLQRDRQKREYKCVCEREIDAKQTGHVRHMNALKPDPNHQAFT